MYLLRNDKRSMIRKILLSHLFQAGRVHYSWSSRWHNVTSYSHSRHQHENLGDGNQIEVNRSLEKRTFCSLCPLQKLRPGQFPAGLFSNEILNFCTQSNSYTSQILISLTTLVMPDLRWFSSTASQRLGHSRSMSCCGACRYETTLNFPATAIIK